MTSVDFTAANARAQGLGAQLFTRAELEALAGQDLPSLVRQLSRSPRLAAPLDERAGLAELERAVRHTTRHHLRTLGRWDGAAPALGVFWTEQDRRSLRAMLRGSMSSAPAEERLAGLLPTPALPERVLAELARQPTPAAVVSVLFVVQHPLAERLLPLTAEKHPDLLALELALAQGWAERATRAAKQGDAALRRFVTHRIDVTNLQAALLLREAKDVAPETWFLPGGAALSLEAFLALAKAAPGASLPAMSPPLRALLSEVTQDPSRFERAAFASTLAEVRARAKVEPLSSLPLLLFLLRLEAQARDLRRLASAASLSAPAAVVKPELVMP